MQRKKNQLVEEDEEVPADLRTMREMVKLGSSIDQMIQLTGDCPSKNENGKMPLLNTEVWVEDNKVQFEHYRKPSANPLLMLEMSAMPANVKRSVLTQEVVTIMKNMHSIALVRHSQTRGGGHNHDFSNYKWKSLSLQIRIMDVKRFFENSTSLTLHQGSENPHYRVKIENCCRPIE